MKKALIIIVSVIALILIVAAFLPSHVRVERSTEIDAPVAVVFDQVVNLEKYMEWSPWSEKDTAMEVTWGETSSGLGASYSWKGNKDVGTGTMTVSKVEENALIENDLDFGDMGTGKGIWTFEPIYVEGEEGDLNAEKTLVTWAMETDMSWPIERYFGMFMDQMVGPDFEHGLENLKAVAEAVPVEPEIPVELIDVMEVTMLSVKDTVQMDQISQRIGEMYSEIIDVMQKNEIEVRSNPICVYHHWDESGGYTVMEAGIPVLKTTKAKVEGNVKMSGIPPCQAAMAVHMGSYESMGKTHGAIDKWISENEKQVVGPPWEVYITDPQSEPDTSKWISEIYYPVQ